MYVSSSRAGAFDWVRNNFQPEREAPSSKNVIVIRPLYIDRQLSGRVAFTAAQDRKGELVFRDSQTSLPVER